MNRVKIIECPRDAWQGLAEVIPTGVKADYLRGLIESGFRHIDAVSFVSPRHVPQMADSEAVLSRLEKAGLLGSGAPEIIGIVVNQKGMERALAAPGVSTLGYPYSISEHFCRANANMSLAESRTVVEKLKQAADAAGRKLVIYISMAFGNPYGDPWGPEVVEEALDWLKAIGIRTVSLADTVGTAVPKLVGELFGNVSRRAEALELGVHLHSRREDAGEKVLAAYEAGCRRFDSALTGLGGCPFAGDELVGNIPTEMVVETLAGRGAETGLDREKLAGALARAREIRARYGS